MLSTFLRYLPLSVSIKAVEQDESTAKSSPLPKAEKLPPPYREVILLVCVHERSVTAAADLLCRNRETVRKQLQRGKKLLIALCRKEGMEFGEEKTTCL